MFNHLEGFGAAKKLQILPGGGGRASKAVRIPLVASQGTLWAHCRPFGLKIRMVAGVTRMMAKFLKKNQSIFGHRWPFLVVDGPPLALPGSVLTPFSSPRPGLDRLTPDNDLFELVFPNFCNFVIFWTPSDPLLPP